MGKDRWITGAEILQRWRALDFELLQAFQNGLHPYGTVDGVRLAPGSKCYHQYVPKHGLYPLSNSRLLDQLKLDKFKLAEVQEYEVAHGIDLYTDSLLPLTLDESTPPPPPEPPTQSRKTRRGTMTRPNAALLCGVCENTIKNWDNAKTAPICSEPYPGRNSWAAFKRWSLIYQGEKQLRAAAIQANNATPISPTDIDQLTTEGY